MKRIALVEAQEQGLLKNSRFVNIDEYVKVANEVSKFVLAEVICCFSDQEDELYLEYCDVQLVNHKHINVSYFNKTGYTFHIGYHLYNHTYSDNAIEQMDGVSNLIKPNNIKVLNQRKITEWINYLTSLKTLIDVHITKNDNVISEFKKSIEGLPVVWHADKMSGYIVKNGIKYKFYIAKNGITSKVELDYTVDNSLQTFLNLSDNKYSKK